MTPRAQKCKVVGFIKISDNTNGIPSADYMDYMRGREIDCAVIERDLMVGNLPPGLVIWTGSKLGIVVGSYGKPQRFYGLKVIRGKDG